MLMTLQQYLTMTLLIHNSIASCLAGIASQACDEATAHLCSYRWSFGLE